jgi:hypothetical protein
MGPMPGEPPHRGWNDWDFLSRQPENPCNAEVIE